MAPDARFLVTRDDYMYSGDGANALVIYDLVRGEHSSYNAKEFIPEEIRRTLPGDSLFGFK